MAFVCRGTGTLPKLSFLPSSIICILLCLLGLRDFLYVVSKVSHRKDWCRWNYKTCIIHFPKLVCEKFCDIYCMYNEVRSRLHVCVYMYCICDVYWYVNKRIADKNITFSAELLHETRFSLTMKNVTAIRHFIDVNDFKSSRTHDVTAHCRTHLLNVVQLLR